MIQNALLSVSDKTGIVDFAKGLGEDLNITANEVLKKIQSNNLLQIC